MPSVTSRYSLIRARRRTVTLQVKQGGVLVVRAPLLYPKYLIDRFVESHADWIRRQQEKLAAPKATLTRLRSDDDLKKMVQQLVEKYAASMDLHPARIRFTHVHSYWGTCSPAKVLSFNLRLAYAPSHAVEYVVVHELSHLRYRGHGVRFWELVCRTFPGTAAARKSLRLLTS